MPATPVTTIGAVWDRLQVVIGRQGFAPARAPFDFDLQPDGTLDQTYCLSTSRKWTLANVGGPQSEGHRTVIHLARRTRRDPWGAARQLKVDMDLLEAALVDEYYTQAYTFDDDTIDAEVQDPRVDRDFVIARFAITIDFDHQL